MKELHENVTFQSENTLNIIGQMNEAISILEKLISEDCTYEENENKKERLFELLNEHLKEWWD